MDHNLSLQQGTLLWHGTYRIERILGQGGFGITYLATDLLLDRLVAVKELFPQKYCRRDTDSSDVSVWSSGNSGLFAQLKERFVKEARNLAKLDHPGIVRIHAVFEEHGTAYYIMDYVHGKSLEDYVEEKGGLSWNEALGFARKIGDALEYIHSRQLNHLDVKPANVMVGWKSNTPVLIDFGLAKQYNDDGSATSTAVWGVSEGYAPLEQYKSGGLNQFSPQTDLYSLAATLYFMLTFKRPPAAVDMLSEDSLSFPDNIPAYIVRALRKGMDPLKAKRQVGISQFLQELGNGDVAIKPNEGKHAPKRARKSAPTNYSWLAKDDEAVSDAADPDENCGNPPVTLRLTAGSSSRVAPAPRRHHRKTREELLAEEVARKKQEKRGSLLIPFFIVMGIIIVTIVTFLILSASR